MVQILQYAVVEHQGEDSNADDSITEKHVVITSEPVTLEWISRHQRTPKLNTEYLSHPGFWFDSIRPRRVGKLEWHIDIRASRFSFPPRPDDPLEQPADIVLDSELLTEPTLFDNEGRPITNTSGEWIAGVTTDRMVFTYRVSKNVASDPLFLDTYGCALNADPVRLRGRLRAPLTLQARRFALGPYLEKNRVRYCVLSFELHYRPDTWIQNKWNVGTLEAVPYFDSYDSNGKGIGRRKYRQVPIKAGSPARPIENAVPLDKEGRVVPGVLDPTGATPIDFSKMIKLDINTQKVLPFNNVLPLR
jgi:hypothetical protein